MLYEQTDTGLALDKHKKISHEEVSFGQQFKTLRAHKGITLKAVSDETRIAVSTLCLIEEEAYDKLPDPVFVKGFLRSYATMMGIDPDRVVQSYLAGRHHYYQSLQFEAGLLRGVGSFWPRIVLSTVLFVFLITASITILRDRRDGPPLETVVPPPQSTPETAPESKSEADLLKIAEPEEAEGEYLLQIEVVQKTWLKVIADRLAPKEYDLNPGDRLELKATSGFNLLIGNATGVHLRLNSQPVVVEGRRGQVVTLKLP